MKKIYFLDKMLILPLMCVSVMVAAQHVDKTIIYVGQYESGEIRGADQVAMDSIAQWVDVVFIDQGIFNDAPADSLYGDGADAVGAEGIIISESIGSTGVGNFGLRDNYPVPCITMEGVLTNDPETTDKWPLLLEDGGVWGYGTPEAVDVQWIIADNSHHITQDFDNDQVINYALAADRGVPYLHGIAPSHIILAYAARDDGGADNPTFVQEEAICLGYIANPEILYMNVAYTYLDQEGDDAATPEFYQIMHRAVEFVFDAIWVNDIDPQLADRMDLSVAPNPAIDDLNLSFTLEAGRNITVSLISVTGGLVGNIYEGLSVAGRNEISINLTDYAAGLYFVEVRIDETTASCTKLVHY